MDIYQTLGETPSYEIVHLFTDNMQSSQLTLHNHKDIYEILVVIKGNAVFHVEGVEYIPDEWDVIVVNASEMHVMRVEDKTVYDRIFFNISKDFFIENNCLGFEDIFLKRKLGHDNLIKGNPVIKDCVKRLSECAENKAPEIVIKSMIVELLYYLSNDSHYSERKNGTQTGIKDIITYINENLDSPLKLDDIADKFYLSKYHLCHIFKQHTGMSLRRYVNYKKLLLARELHSKGMRLTDASVEAGFETYSNFYRLYKKEFGSNPKQSSAANNR